MGNLSRGKSPNIRNILNGKSLIKRILNQEGHLPGDISLSGYAKIHVKIRFMLLLLFFFFSAIPGNQTRAHEYGVDFSQRCNRCDGEKQEGAHVRTARSL